MKSKEEIIDLFEEIAIKRSHDREVEIAICLINKDNPLINFQEYANLFKKLAYKLF